ncbi:hypothetical protein BDV23DRAFT_181764 [Aspergillus alliaceus]|uniref:FMN hydroxy acid dehydrogenase domain-containing protein n=1 Tax=Petromyces alliaceus TaxID=209559 RepID=A0A5N7CFP9_PETAA|nr:hypothetical protein BDV23DRAFT_181764 [Aspergillus alliaceus]
MTNDFNNDLTTPFSSYQHEIYVAGTRGIKPIMTTNPNLWETAAKQVMEPMNFDYAKGGAGAGDTIRKNREAFDKWSIIPRMVRSNTKRSLKVDVLGQEWPAPVAIAPVGVNRIFHPDGEKGVARAAGKVGVPYVLSTFASESPEAVAQAQDEAAGHGKSIRWLQLYWPQSVDHDVTALGFTDPVFRRKFAERYGHEADEDILKGAFEWENTIFPNLAHTWSELEFLRKEWDGHILVKGIQTATDAEMVVQAGVDGIIVSNHGGRQYDGAYGSLDALQEIAEAVGDRVDVLFDSGIRTGADVMKALALGAKAVFVGRPVIYGLGAKGKEGALHVLRCLLADLEINLGITGVQNATDLKPSDLRGHHYLSIFLVLLCNGLNSI